MVLQQIKQTGRQNFRCFQYLIDEIGIKKKFTTQTNSFQTEKVATSINWENARPYNEIPGPSTFEFVRSVLPGGVFYKKSVTDLITGFSNKYGSLIRMPGLFSNPEFVACLNLDDIPVVLRNEGKWPSRRNFESIIYFREVHKKDFFDGTHSVLTSSGENWANTRTAVNPVLMQSKNVVLYLNTILEGVEEFIERIREIRDPITKEMPDNFEDDINRFTFESVAAVALNTKLGLIRKNRNSEESKTLLKNLRRVFDLALYLDILPSPWKYISTPKFKEMMNTLDSLTNVCNKYINEALARIEQDSAGNLTSEAGKEKSVLEKLVKIDKKLAIIMAFDMLMAGVDTTSSTLAGIFFCIAKHPDKQEKLFKEIKEIMPAKNSKLTVENMRNLPYLRACIKEGMRLYPIIPGTMRRIPTDIVLSGYQIPAGTEISIGSNLLMGNERYVRRAKEFLPERWLRDEESKKLAVHIENPFLYLPFGFGPRSCVGKRIVNLEMELVVACLVRNFHIEFNYPLENAFKSIFINVPAIPLKFKFEERSA